mgnify:CR=1 FL=1
MPELNWPYPNAALLKTWDILSSVNTQFSIKILRFQKVGINKWDLNQASPGWQNNSWQNNSLPIEWAVSAVKGILHHRNNNEAIMHLRSYACAIGLHTLLLNEVRFKLFRWMVNRISTSYIYSNKSNKG